MAFIAMPSLADSLVDRHIKKLIREDFDSRRACLIDRGRKCDFGMGAPASHTDLLSKGQCPGSKSGKPLTLSLPATGGYTDLENTAYYCQIMGVYWVLRRHGALMGTARSFFGPFVISARQQGPKQLPPQKEQIRMRPSRKPGSPTKLGPSGMKKMPTGRLPVAPIMINAAPSRPIGPSPLAGKMRPITNTPPLTLSPPERKTREPGTLLPLPHPRKDREEDN